MVRNLEHVHGGQTAGEQDGVDVVLGVPGQKEPARLELAEQDDRGVVRLSIARRSRIQRRRTRPTVVRPEDAESGIVQVQGFAGSEAFRLQAVRCQRPLP